MGQPWSRISRGFRASSCGSQVAGISSLEMDPFAANTGGTVPAWVAVLIAVITGAGALMAAAYNAHAARKGLKEQLAVRSEEFERQLAARSEEVRSERAVRSEEFERQLAARSEEVRSERAARFEELQRQLAHDRALRVRDEYRTALDEAAAVGVRVRERLAAALRDASASHNVPPGTVKPLVLDRDDLIELRAAEARLTMRFGPSHEVTHSFQKFYEAVKDGVKLARTATEAQAVGTSEAQVKRARARSALDEYLTAAQRALDANARLEPDRTPQLATDATSSPVVEPTAHESSA